MRRSFIPLAIAAMLLGSSLLQAAPPLVAMLDFAPDDNSRGSAAAATDFTAALQVQLLDASGVIWVEREQLKIPADELVLSAIASSGADALRMGKWAKADILLLGRFEVNKQMRVLSLQAVDLDHADVLVDRKFPLGEASFRIGVLGDELPAARDGAAAVLADAIKVKQDLVGRRSLAVLVLANISPTDRLSFVERDLNAAIAKEAEKKGVRLLRFPKSDESINEAELAVMGLVDADPEAWQHVADMYAWGTCKEAEAKNVSFEQTELDIQLSLWNGKTTPTELSVHTTVGELPKSLEQLAAQAVAAALAPMPATMGSGSREEVARTVANRAVELRRELEGTSRRGFYAASGNNARQYILQLWQTASFLAPQNRDYRRELLLSSRLMATTQPEMRNPLLTPWASEWSRYADRFGFVTDGKIDAGALREYVSAQCGAIRMMRTNPKWETAPFGLSRQEGLALQNALARRLVKQVERLAQVSREWSATQPSLPQIDPAVSSAARETIDCARRDMEDPRNRVQIIDAMWPIYKPAYQWSIANGGRVGIDVAGIRDAYAAIGEVDRALFMLSEPAPPQPAPALPTSRPTTMPGWSEAIRRKYSEQYLRKADEASRALYERAMAARSEAPSRAPVRKGVLPSIPLVEAQARWVSLEQTTSRIATQPQEYRILNTTCGAGRLWLNLLWPRGMSTPVFPAFRAYDPVTDAFEDFSETVVRPPVGDVVFASDKLWLGMRNDGVWTLDPKARSVTRLTGQDGVPTSMMNCAIRDGNRLLFGGVGKDGRAIVAALEMETGRWTSLALPGNSALPELPPLGSVRQLWACKDWLLIDADALVLVNTRTGKAIDPAALLESDVVGREPPPRMSLSMVWSDLRLFPREGTVAAASDGQGFWLATEREIVHYDPDSGVLERVPVPVGPIGRLIVEGDCLWVIADEPRWPDAFDDRRWTAPIARPERSKTPPSRLLLWSIKDHRWLGQCALNVAINTVVSQGDRIFIGTEAVSSPLLEIDRGRFGLPPASDEERDVAASSAPALVKAAYLGQVDVVRRLLDSGTDADTTTKEGHTALMAAVREHRHDVMQLLLGRGANVHAKRKDSSATALQMAAEVGDDVAIQILLTAKASVSGTDVRGCTPLMAAAAGGHLKATQLLLASGAKALAGTAMSSTALDLAVRTGRADVVHALVKSVAESDVRQGQYGGDAPRPDAT